MDEKEVIKKCVCHRCPSYVECGDKKGFCKTGKSKCIKKESGCICMTCPVQEKTGIDKVYYCINGKDPRLK